MTATAILGLKQKFRNLSEPDRREGSALLIQLGRESGEWKKETARRLSAMASGKQRSVAALRRRLGQRKNSFV